MSFSAFLCARSRAKIIAVAFALIVPLTIAGQSPDLVIDVGEMLVDRNAGVTGLLGQAANGQGAIVVFAKDAAGALQE